MKKNTVIYTILFFSLSINLHAQRLTLSDLSNLCNKANWGIVNQILLSKGWTYYSSEKGNSEQFSTITWSFAKEDYSDKAQAWLYLYTYDDYPSKITYSVFNKESYTLIQNALSTLGFSLVDSEIGDDAITTTYTSASFILFITTRKIDDNDWAERSYTAYSISLIKKAGIFDPDNGEKTEYFDNGLIEAEYTLKNGEMDGPLLVYYDNGRLKKKGSFIQGKANGKFYEYNEEGILTADYTKYNDEYHGLVSIYEDGNISQVIEYKNGVITGKYTEYYYNDEGNLYLKVVGQYNNGMKNGRWESILIDNGKEEVVEYQNYLNDTKHGDFKQYIGSDTIEIAHYNNGVLNGLFTRRTKLSGFTSESGEEISWWNLDCEGEYLNGLKNGKWTHYLFGQKNTEGTYLKDKKIGKWTSYTVMGDRNGEVMSITEYSNDLRNGISETLYHVTGYRDSTDAGEVYKFKSTPIYELTTYKDDLKNGNYILKDSTGVLMAQGKFINDKKSGKWIESYTPTGSENRTVRLYQEGEYQNDKREGKWIEYLIKDKPLLSFNYTSDELDGEYIEWNNVGKQRKKKQFKNGDFNELIVYDSLGINPIREYEIYDVQKNGHHCRLTEYHNDGTESQEYWLESDEQGVDHHWYELSFVMRTGDFSDGKSGYKDGEYKSYNLNHEPLILGKYYKGSKTGLWTFFYYEQGVKIEANFTDDVKIDEKYYLLNGWLFSGEFTFTNKADNILEYRQIKNGLRNGKTTYYDLDTGGIIKKESYKNGKLK